MGNTFITEKYAKHIEENELVYRTKANHKTLLEGLAYNIKVLKKPLIYHIYLDKITFRYVEQSMLYYVKKEPKGESLKIDWDLDRGIVGDLNIITDGVTFYIHRNKLNNVNIAYPFDEKLATDDNVFFIKVIK